MDNKKIIKYFYEIVVSKNLIHELPKYISEKCVFVNNKKNILIGLSGMKQHLIEIKKTYPDYKMTIIRQFVSNDYIISEFIMEGTLEGEWIGIKPTYKKLSFNGINIDKVIDGKIVEHSGFVNTFETLLENNLIKPV